MCGTQYPNTSSWSCGFGLTGAYLDLAPRFGVRFQAKTQVSSSGLPDSIKISHESGRPNSVWNHQSLSVGFVSGSDWWLSAGHGWPRRTKQTWAQCLMCEWLTWNQSTARNSSASSLFFPYIDTQPSQPPLHPPGSFKLSLLSPSPHSRKRAVCLPPVLIFIVLH